MTHILSENTCLSAWQGGVDLISSVVGHSVFNLVVSIELPIPVDQSWMNDYCPTKIGGERMRDVVNTIFPFRYIGIPDREAVYNRYAEAHQRAHRLGRNQSWGAYFERFISFGQSDFNQIDLIIEALSNRGAALRAGFVMHTNSCETNSPVRLRGNPCLQYVQFVMNEPSVVDMFAVYRNHDFANKALGNYIGLAYLLQFVCMHSGKNTGKIVCHSMHADFGGKSARDVRALARI